MTPHTIVWLRACEASTCVEAAWQRACSSATNCVEAHGEADRVLIRDSKHPDGPVITLTMAEWWELVRAAGTWSHASGPHRFGEGLALIPMYANTDDQVCVVRFVDDVHLHFTEAEFDAFVAGLRSGAFDSIGREAP